MGKTEEKEAEVKAAEENVPQYISNQTVGEMGDQDRDNFDYLMQNKTFIKRFNGPSPQKVLDAAMRFSGACLDAILRHYGFKMTQKLAQNPGMVDRLLKERYKLRIETRRYPPEEEVYQTGIYVLKLRAAGAGDMIDHEIVGFVSEPFVWKQGGKIIQLQPDICVRTTYSL